ncbi:hypothetical protein G6F50_016843 [Rhizopus delemar]|uniref:Uncharacterized protein n=1 Tax=Rhizopus delemar TaxID=936053 RepID=A0A9P7C151_9FUNG|nr:hypothetical protein G6F50_016843 [Rhizopus delemar]
MAAPVGGLVAQRCRQRAEVILVVRVGARQADQERGTAGVADPGAEALVLEVGTHVVGVLRGAQQVVRAIRPGVRGRAIGVGVVGIDAEVLADRLLVGHFHAGHLAVGIDRGGDLSFRSM